MGQEVTQLKGVIWLAKVLIVYESKFGNTRGVAQAIAEGIGQVAGTEVIVSELKGVDPDQLGLFDAIIVGSPNHIGRATRGIRKFTDTLGKCDLTGKLVAVFNTYIGGDYQKAMSKMEKQLAQRSPGLKLATPGLSVKVAGMKGPIADGELPRCHQFGAGIAHQLSDRE